jgi:hypothetical protein
MDKIYRQWLDTCRQANIPAISTDTAARLMAVLHEYGNNEGFTYNKRFLADMDYIQKRFGLHEMGVVEPAFQVLLKEYIEELQEYQKAHKDDKCDNGHPYRSLAPDWAPELIKERYSMKFIG